MEYIFLNVGHILSEIHYRTQSNILMILTFYVLGQHLVITELHYSHQWKLLEWTISLYVVSPSSLFVSFFLSPSSYLHPSIAVCPADVSPSAGTGSLANLEVPDERGRGGVNS